MDPILKYKNAKKKLILLDYDGTLVDFTVIPDEAKPSVRLLNVLYKLSCDPSTKIVIITGREYKSIDKLIGHLPVEIIAEHGTMIKKGGIWNDLIKNNSSWKAEFLGMFNRYTSECPGSFTEEKRFSIVWHYRNVDMMKGYIFSREVIRQVYDKIRSNDLRIIDGNKTLEIITNGASKGKIINNLLKNSHYDYVLSIGDDVTEEDIFEFPKDDENYITIKVGYGNTSEKYRLDSPNEVIQLLERLSN